MNVFIVVLGGIASAIILLGHLFTRKEEDSVIEDVAVFAGRCVAVVIIMKLCFL